MVGGWSAPSRVSLMLTEHDTRSSPARGLSLSSPHRVALAALPGMVGAGLALWLAMLSVCYVHSLAYLDCDSADSSSVGWIPDDASPPPTHRGDHPSEFPFFPGSRLRLCPPRRLIVAFAAPVSASSPPLAQQAIDLSPAARRGGSTIAATASRFVRTRTWMNIGSSRFDSSTHARIGKLGAVRRKYIQSMHDQRREVTKTVLFQRGARRPLRIGGGWPYLV
jgi:hypothetical protein